jgi:protein tyrosine phosphatase
MAKELDVSTHFEITLFVNKRKYRYQTEKIMDITGDCPKANKENRFLLLYGRTKGKGRFVQLAQYAQRHENEVNNVDEYFFLNNIDEVMEADIRHDYFGLWADKLGLHKWDLLTIIKKHAPAA